ncbi:hypothetical protein ACFU53_08275 [Streptomyces sp. NPDC057474]|uniref:hypothetical protein n=1 Tax=Streptomyces sp. NPDC057474 TaxID=3346144 RepID=UPI0036AAECA2
MSVCRGGVVRAGGCRGGREDPLHRARDGDRCRGSEVAEGGTVIVATQEAAAESTGDEDGTLTEGDDTSTGGEGISTGGGTGTDSGTSAGTDAGTEQQ